MVVRPQIDRYDQYIPYPKYLRMYVKATDATATGFRDFSGYGFPLTVNGSTTGSTTQKRINPNSIYMPNYTSYLQYPNSTGFSTGTDPFTISLWWYPTAVAANAVIFSKASGWGTIGPITFLCASGNLQLYATNTTAWDISNGKNIGTYTLNAWNHVYVTRSSAGVYKAYLNGVIGSDFPFTDTRALISNSYPITLGQPGSYAGCTWYMDEILYWCGVDIPYSPQYRPYTFGRA